MAETFVQLTPSLDTCGAEKTGGVKSGTVNTALPDTEPELARTKVVPAFTAVAKPVPVPTVATVLEVTDQMRPSEAVSARLVPSVKVPEAVNCWKFPGSAAALEGLTDIEVSRITPAVVLSQFEKSTKFETVSPWPLGFEEVFLGPVELPQ